MREKRNLPSLEGGDKGEGDKPHSKMGKINVKNIETISREIKDIESLKKFLMRYFDNEVKVYLVGSRARRDNTEFSDIDIVIDSEADIRDEISLLKWILEESNLPQKVDIICLKDAPYFEKIIREEGTRWI